MQPQRKIIHIDMDCFYAAIEERDNPALKSKPVAVGGLGDRRGVLCTCNYVARSFGLHAAMATSRALQRCPQLIVLPVDMLKYRAVSQQIRQVFFQYTDQVEPLSLDEAYLDVSHVEQLHNSATLIARAIKHQIKQELNLIASAGVGPNKLLAKIASDWRKPDGLFVITPAEVASFMQTLPVGKLFGVGRVTSQKLLQLNIETCADLQRHSKLMLIQYFGKSGERLYEMSRGIDAREVKPNRVRKSLSVEYTMPHDLTDLAAAQPILQQLHNELLQRLQRQPEQRLIKNLFVKLKFYDFQQTTVECLGTQPYLTTFHVLTQQAYSRQHKAIRLLGLGVRFADDTPAPQYQQMSLAL